MAETYPGHSSEFGSDSGKKGSGSGSYRPIIQKVGGDTPFRFGDGPHPRPLGEAIKSEQEHKTGLSATELHSRAAATAAEQVLRHEAVRRHEEERDDSSDDGSEAGGKKTTEVKPKNYRGDPKKDRVGSISPDGQTLIESSQWLKDVGVTDAGEKAGDRTIEQERGAAETEPGTSGASNEVSEDAAIELPEAETSPGEASDAESLRSQLEAALVEEARNEAEALSEPIGPPAEQNPHQLPETETAFADIAAAPEMADLADMQLPEATGVLEDGAEPESFTDWVQREHPELSVPELAATDDGFNDIVRHNFGEDVDGGPTRFYEREPGEPPDDASGGANKPPNPPTANGGNWHNGPNWSPNFGNAGNANNASNPNFPNNPWATAGNLLNPATLAGVSALEARQRLDSLRHTAREMGLAGAIGVLGLGLVADHLWARHRFKKDKKAIKALNKNLQQTNKSLERERQARLETQHQLDHLHNTPEVADRPVHQAVAHKTAERTVKMVEHSPAAAEKTVGIGLISGTAAAELAARAGAMHEQVRSLSNEELAHRLKHSRELGRAIKRNPELRDEGLVGTGTAGEVTELQREMRHERLPDQAADADYQLRPGTGGGNTSQDIVTTPSLPQPTDAAQAQAPAPRFVQPVPPQKKPALQSQLKNPWTWATIAVILAIAVIAT